MKNFVWVIAWLCVGLWTAIAAVISLAILGIAWAVAKLTGGTPQAQPPGKT